MEEYEVEEFRQRNALLLYTRMGSKSPGKAITDKWSEVPEYEFAHACIACKMLQLQIEQLLVNDEFHLISLVNM